MERKDTLPCIDVFCIGMNEKEAAGKLLSQTYPNLHVNLVPTDITIKNLLEICKNSKAEYVGFLEKEYFLKDDYYLWLQEKLSESEDADLCITPRNYITEEQV